VEEQTSLLFTPESLPALRDRSDGASVRRRFSQSIQANGGDSDAQRDATIAETEELFGCSPKDLYRGTGGKQPNRSTLPAPVQEAYMVNEVLSANELDRMEGTLGGDSQAEVNAKIVGVVREQSRQTRRFFPW
jgi:hypothetical protein